MSDAPIFFEFEDERSAYMALDTLHELSYRSDFVDAGAKPTLHVHVDRQDVTSALEIAQAHGGRLTELDEALTEAGTFAMAYELDEGIRIPAHFVSEDFQDGYAEPQADTSDTESAQGGGSLIDSANVFHAGFDPSTDSYDGFSPGIRL